MIIYDKQSRYRARYRENENLSIEMTIDFRAMSIDRFIFSPDPVVSLWAVSHTSKAWYLF